MKVEQAVKEADYKQLMEKVLDSLQEKRGKFCENIYSTLKEIPEEVGQVSTHISNISPDI